MYLSNKMTLRICLVYHLFMGFVDARLGLPGFVDVFICEPSYRRVILVIRANPCELLCWILIAFKKVAC